MTPQRNPSQGRVSSSKIRLAEQAVAVEHARAELLQRLPHELRRPLAMANSHLSMVLLGAQGDLDPRVRDALEQVLTNLEEMGDLLTAMTDEVLGELDDTSDEGVTVTGRSARQRQASPHRG